MVRFVSFLIFLIVVNNITLAEYGNLQLLFAVLGPAPAFVVLGLNRVIVSDIARYLGSEKYFRARKLAIDFLKTIFIMSVVMVGLLLLLKGVIDGRSDIDVAPFFLPLVALTLGQIGMNYVSSMLEAHSDFLNASILNLLEVLVRFLLLLTLFYFHFSIFSVLWVYVFSKIVPPVFYVPVLWRKINKRGINNKMKEKNLLWELVRQHGKWDMLRETVDKTTSNIWPFILRVFASGEAVAIYAFAQKILSFATSLLPVKSVLFPIISSTFAKGQDEAVKIIVRSKKYLLAVYLVIVLVGLIATGPVVEMFARDYTPAVPFVQIMLFHMILEVYSLGQVATFYALKKQKYLFWIGNIIMVSRLLSEVMLIYLFGIWGLIASWFLISFTTYILRDMVLINKLNLHLWMWRSLFVFDEFDKQLLRKIRLKLNKKIV